MTASQPQGRRHRWLPVRTARVTILVTTVALLLGLTGSVTAGTSQTKPILRLGLPSGFVAGDPGGGSNVPDNTIRPLAYASVFYTKPNGQIIGGLATKWRYLTLKGRSRNKDFEFTLRRDARFSDGTRVTAQAVKTWLEFYRDTPTHPLRGNLGPNPVFQAVGQWTVRIRLTIPNPQLPYFFSSSSQYWGMVASPRAVANPALFATGTYGAGPYMLDPARTIVNNQYTFVPNPYYFDKNSVKYREILVRIIPNAASMVQALQARQIDVALGTPTTAAAAEAAGFNVVAAPVSTSYLNLADRGGTLAPPLKDVRVRRAMNFAIDRKTIAQAVLGKWSTPTAQLVTDGFTTKHQNFYPYNPQRARTLLREAGYPNGFTLKTLLQGFNTLNLPQTYEAAAKYLDAVGIKLDITSPPTIGGWLEGAQSATWPAFQHGIGGPMISIFPSLMHPTAAPILNPFRTNDPEINRLYYRALTAKNPNLVWRQLNARIVEQAYLMPVGTVSNFYFHSNRVGGVVRAPRIRSAVSYASEWFPK